MRYVSLISFMLFVLICMMALEVEGATIYIILLILIGLCLTLFIIQIGTYSKSEKRYRITESCDPGGKIVYTVQETTFCGWRTGRTGYASETFMYYSSKGEALEYIEKDKKWGAHKTRIVHEE